MALATAFGRPAVLPDGPDRAQHGRRGGWHLGLGSRALLPVLLTGAVLSWASPAAASPPAFEDMDPVDSSDGTLQLSWGEDLADDIGEYEVQLTHEGQTRRVYHGKLPEAHVSGLPDGRYELRVRKREGDSWSEWSEAKVLRVTHHPMSLVWTLMALGALVFTATAMVVLRSDRGSQ